VFDAAFTSFTLELFPLDDIPVVLAEIRRVLRDGGRLGVVSMATVKQGERASLLEKTYVWMHRHFPHIVDCQPIDVAQCLADAGFDVQDEIDMEIWTMPVRAVLGVEGSA
jgi:demethylmenaquinone methyltransferase/2-methoxy-6-polyprenyl-1,4-benzoquinol methylase